MYRVTTSEQNILNEQNDTFRMYFYVFLCTNSFSGFSAHGGETQSSAEDLRVFQGKSSAKQCKAVHQQSQIQNAHLSTLLSTL